MDPSLRWGDGLLTMADLLLELLSEEIPARMQQQACITLQKMIAENFKSQNLTFDSIDAYATPRRLALHVTGLPLAQPDVSEELKGPRTDAPEQALAGFLKKTGLTKEQLQPRDDGKKGQVYFAVIERTGRATSEVIADIIPTIIRTFPWPKSMRWGERSASTESLRWVRPLQSIICLLDGAVVPFDIDTLKSGNVTRGHRFMSMSQFTVDSFEDYRTKLRLSKVILDPAERMKLIDGQARALANKAGLVLVEDAGLLAENAGLTEWPVVLIGSFDAAYLDVPAECLTATMRANQKYFSLRDGEGKLANKFLCVANLEAKDKGKSIVAGNEKVLSARLSDAKFFWDQDRKHSLESYLPKLEQIIFHEKLGTMADKVARVEKLAAEIARVVYPQLVTINKAVTPAQAGVHASGKVDVESMDPSRSLSSGSPSAMPGGWSDENNFVATVQRAAHLCKADLTTGMVGEFPELQGIMGRYYALANGEGADVALAIEEHYKPQGPSDTVPTNPVSVCVALADKIDSIISFFYIEEAPTGSKDPFALRRGALGTIALLNRNNIRLNLLRFIPQGGEDNLDIFAGRFFDIDERIASHLLDFFIDRLKVQQREAGIRHDIIDAVFAQGDDDLVRLLARVKALQAFLETDDGANLLAGYKRAANILKIEEKKDGVTYALDLETLNAKYIGKTEKNLARVFAGSENADSILFFDEADALFGKENFTGLMQKLATLRAPVDAFFADVMVNDPDPAVRVRRLKLLAGVREAMHKVADFSKIEG
jgi:glycyl-tRNA synthetase beta chain